MQRPTCQSSDKVFDLKRGGATEAKTCIEPARAFNGARELQRELFKLPLPANESGGAERVMQKTTKMSILHRQEVPSIIEIKKLGVAKADGVWPMADEHAQCKCTHLRFLQPSGATHLKENLLNVSPHRTN